MLDYRAKAPFAAENHPSDEHLLPFFLALGAATPPAAGHRLHAGIMNGALAMDAFRWD